MELLVKRDGNELVKTEGKASVSSDVPDFLRTPRVVPQEQVTIVGHRDKNDDLLILNGEAKDPKDIIDVTANISHTLLDIQKLLHHKFGTPFTPESIPGLWSGYRSALVQDPDTKRLFRLKGVSLDPQNPQVVDLEDGSYRIQGGQEGFSSRFERSMSNRFGKALEDIGIEPVMKVKGMWTYPVMARNVRPTASIVEVKGDTRLDELVLIIDGLASRKLRGDLNGRKMEVGGYTALGDKFVKATSQFYYDVGYVVGRLKRLMDRSGQTWSSDHNQTNAHWGNIVLYNGSDKVRVGFVDFDASCDIDELTHSEFKALQEREYENIIRSFLGDTISLRKIEGLPFSGRIFCDLESRKQHLVRSFREGYESGKRSYGNEVDLGLLEEIFSLLRAEEDFTFAPHRRTTGGILEEGDYLKRTGIGLDNIIRNHYNYQKDLDYGSGITGIRNIDDYLKDSIKRYNLDDKIF